MNSSDKDIKYLKLLSSSYRNVGEVSNKLIHLQAILNLPKGTEHFLSDIHGEYDAFYNVLKNSSGVIKAYIDEIYGNTLEVDKKRDLAALIYYPVEKIDFVIMKNKYK